MLLRFQHNSSFTNTLAGQSALIFAMAICFQHGSLRGYTQSDRTSPTLWYVFPQNPDFEHNEAALIIWNRSDFLDSPGLVLVFRLTTHRTLGPDVQQSDYQNDRSCISLQPSHEKKRVNRIYLFLSSEHHLCGGWIMNKQHYNGLGLWIDSATSSILRLTTKSLSKTSFFASHFMALPI